MPVNPRLPEYYREAKAALKAQTEHWKTHVTPGQIALGEVAWVMLRHCEYVPMRKGSPGFWVNLARMEPTNRSPRLVWVGYGGFPDTMDKLSQLRKTDLRCRVMADYLRDMLGEEYRNNVSFAIEPSSWRLASYICIQCPPDDVIRRIRARWYLS